MTEISMITIAPAGYDGRADFVCTGRHDERVIQQAVQAASQARKNVFFYNALHGTKPLYKIGKKYTRTTLKSRNGM